MTLARRPAAAGALVLAAALLLHDPARAGLVLPPAEEGPWLAADKELHFAGSLALSASIRAAGRDRASALGGAISIGLAKELYDATLKPGPVRGASRRDLVVDVLGALAGVLLLEALDR